MLSHLARKVLPSSVKDVLQVYRPLQLSAQVTGLSIVQSGIDDTGFPFVRLATDKIFYGYRPSRLEEFIYKYLLTKDAKKNLQPYAFRIALDIIFRYRGTQSSPLRSGKFYDYKPGETVVECGAYLGYYSMKASEIVGETGRVISIEPINENRRILRANVSANDIKNITIVPKGIWNAPLEMQISRERRQRASLVDNVVKDVEQHTISCDSIDNILHDLKIDSIDFIRIQVNGAELEALKGMKRTLPRTKRILVSALYKRDGKYAYNTVETILSGNGFRTTVSGGNVLGIRS